MADEQDREQTHSITIRAPIDAVWSALTRTGEKQPFYFDSVLDTELRAGSPLRYRSVDDKRTFIRGEVLEVDAPRRFSHTLRFTHLAEPPSPVTFELEAKGDETTVTIRHTNIEGPKHRSMVKRGWPFILNNLRSVLETGRLPMKTRFQHTMMKLFSPFMPAEKPWPPEQR